MSLVTKEVGSIRATELAANRADQQIAETAAERLQTCHYKPLRVLRCECNDGVLTLAGRVPSFYHRQLAQAFVRDIAGVNQIIDQLQVVN